MQIQPMKMSSNFIKKINKKLQDPVISQISFISPTHNKATFPMSYYNSSNGSYNKDISGI